MKTLSINLMRKDSGLNETTRRKFNVKYRPGSEIIPKCGKAIAGDYADYAVSYCSDIDLKRWMNG